MSFLKSIEILWMLMHMDEFTLRQALKDTDNPKFKEIIQDTINVRFPWK